MEIFSTALAKAKTKSLPFKYDSLLTAFTQKSIDSPEVALEYANRFKQFVSMLEYNREPNTSTDTTKYFELRLVNIEVYVGSAKLDFELKNLLDKTIYYFGLKASLRDKNGEYLADELSLTWENIRPNGIGIAGTWWADVKLNDIGGVLLIPYEVNVEGEVYRLNGRNVKIIENKYGLKVSF